ncbi:MAG: arginine deiminase family protein, partial [Bacteroidota bacterium]
NDLLGHEVTFIPCGGDLISQQREQWTDGANLFALRPGLVVGYTRNRETYAKMREHGFHVVGAEDFLQFYGDSEMPTNGKIAIRLEGNELSRGRGGPRCMTMPLVRDAG